MSFEAAFKAMIKAAKRPKMPAEDQLLSREDFDKYVKLRSAGYCVFCDKLAVDSHHILDRKLFPDGGYYLGNGAAVCEMHHVLCERTLIPVKQVRESAHIENPVLPPGFSKHANYDKWGNTVISRYIILLGPLKSDDGMLKALKAGGKAAYLYHKIPYMVDGLDEAQ